MMRLHRRPLRMGDMIDGDGNLAVSGRLYEDLTVILHGERARPPRGTPRERRPTATVDTSASEGQATTEGPSSDEGGDDEADGDEEPPSSRGDPLLARPLGDQRGGRS
jgi:hypothetical protein